MLINRKPSEKQIAASRANGQKSRGPVTPEGKFNSATRRSANGILAQTVVLKGESPEKFRQLVDALHAELLPESPIEIQLIESIAVARWRQMRLWALEKATIVSELSKIGPEAAPGEPGALAIDRTATACQSLVNGSHWTEHMSRAEYRHDRLYNRAMALFRKHRAWRREELKNAASNPTLE